MNIVETIMTEFADSTGLTDGEKPARRYLWTDAFAVCNFLGLYRQTGDEGWRDLALRLVDQVHDILGRHREDDPRTGWISGLSEEEGKRRPTTGGLRIGKEVNERRPSEPYDEAMEWDRDGQYYHYLTKWMYALNRVSRSTGNPAFNFWAAELAKAAHAGFFHVLQDGSKVMCWKMSIDLSYPLVPAMGQHDPLDGLVTYIQIQATAEEFSEESPDISPEIDDMAALCKGKSWATTDPLGIGGLLSDAYRVVRLIMTRHFTDTGLLSDLLTASLRGLDALSENPFLDLPPDYRLAFRELGMAIGLHAMERIRGAIEEKPDIYEDQPFRSQIHGLERFTPLIEKVERFWLDPQNRNARTWTEHLDINRVMLATSLYPDGYLDL